MKKLIRKLKRTFSVVRMKKLERAFGLVRDELCDVGLLENGRYLDRIECMRAVFPSGEAMGYVCDTDVHWFLRLIGFKPGEIYIVPNIEVLLGGTGETIEDVIRHEFAHQWAWLDRKFIAGQWFKEAFGAAYCGKNGHGKHAAQPEREDYARNYANDFCSPYACTHPCEDFAETFMIFLRERKNLSIFRAQKGVYRKLKAVEKAVNLAAKERVHRVRGPKK